MQTFSHAISMRVSEIVGALLLFVAFVIVKCIYSFVLIINNVI